MPRDLIAAASRYALIAGVGLALAAPIGGKAVAADLGGDCCVDLEARVAALEASSVTHQDHKVSMKISGWFNAAMVYWNDHGGATDARDPAFHDQTSGFGVVNNSASQTRISFEGSAKVSGDFAVGYALGVRPLGDKLGDASQLKADVNPNNVDIRDTYVYMESKTWGRVQLGEQYSAADNAWYEDLGGSSTWISNVNPAAWNSGFYLRDAHGALSQVTWGDVLGEGSDTQVPRLAYFSRTWNGLQAAASVGGDDTWGAALYFNKTVGSVSVAAGAGYDVSSGASALSDQNVGTGLVAVGADRLAKLALSGSVYESRTGLYGTVGYSKTAADAPGRDDASNLYGKVGWRRHVNALGETNLYGEYDRSSALAANGVNANVYGAGVTQDIDAAGSVVYLGFRHAHLEDTVEGANLVLTSAQAASGASPDAAATVPKQSFDAVLGGMVVQF